MQVPDGEWTGERGQATECLGAPVHRRQTKAEGPKAWNRLRRRDGRDRDLIRRFVHQYDCGVRTGSAATLVLLVNAGSNAVVPRRVEGPISLLCRVSLFLSMALCLLVRLFVF